VNAREEAAYRCQYLWRSVLEQALIDAFGGTRNNGAATQGAEKGQVARRESWRSSSRVARTDLTPTCRRTWPLSSNNFSTAIVTRSAQTWADQALSEVLG
jgi:hypothetical protein